MYWTIQYELNYSKFMYWIKNMNEYWYFFIKWITYWMIYWMIIRKISWKFDEDWILFGWKKISPGGELGWEDPHMILMILLQIATPFYLYYIYSFFSINHALHVAWSPTDKGVLQARRRLSLLRTNNYTYIVLLEVKILCPYSEPRSCYIGDKHTEKQTHIRQANLSPTQTPNMVDLNTWPQRNSPFEDGITP